MKYQINKIFCKFCKGELSQIDNIFESHIECEEEFQFIDIRNYEDYFYYQIAFFDKIKKQNEENLEIRSCIKLPIIKSLKEKYLRIFNYSQDQNYIKFIGDFLIENSITEYYYMREIMDAHWLNVIRFLFKLYSIRKINALTNSLFTIAMDRHNSGTLPEYLMRYEYFYPEFRKYLLTNLKDEIINKKSIIGKKKERKKNKNILQIEDQIKRYFSPQPINSIFGVEMDDDESETSYLTKFLFLIELYHKISEFPPIIDYIFNKAKKEIKFNYWSLLEKTLNRCLNHNKSNS
jgi:hypothetical protein